MERSFSDLDALTSKSTRVIHNPIVKGTLILTITGIVTRLLGFALRIFLSRTIGEVGLGLHQLAFPVFMLLHAVAAAGIETAISKCVASSQSKNPSRSFSYFLCGLICCMCICLPGSVLICRFAEEISTFLLNEAACAPLLRMFAYAVPLSCVQGCICNYYYGQKKSGVPALSQFIEQLARIAATVLIWYVLTNNGEVFTPAHAVLAMVIGELITVITIVILFCSDFQITFRRSLRTLSEACSNTIARPLIRFAVPMTVNRLMITALQSIESVAIPLYLRIYGYSSSEAIAVYGVLTGMAMPFILFPTTMTNALAVMLLPTVSDAQAQGDGRKIRLAAKSNISFCFLMGCAFTAVFLISGRFLGMFFYASEQAGNYIKILAWVCPFLYVNGAITSILNGLGQVSVTLRNNVLSMLLRLAFILFGVPRFGMNAYLVGLLTSQLLLGGLHLLALKKELNDQKPNL